MMILYKFVGADRGTKILDRGVIRFTQLSALNDPFESYPPLESFVTKEFTLDVFETVLSQQNTMANVIEDTFKRMYKNLPRNQQQLFDYESFKRIAEIVINKELENLGTTLPKLLRSHFESTSNALTHLIKQNLTQIISNNICVLSLSAAKAYSIMWSHYAESHSGVAIGYDSDHPFFSRAIKVQYQLERPIINLSLSPKTDEERQKLAQTILATKSISWNYEQEYRLLNATASLKKTEQVDSYGFPIFVASFPFESVREIILGACIQDKSMIGIVEAHANKYHKAKLIRATLNRSNFQLGFEDL